MGERMRRIVCSVPAQMVSNLNLIASTDGRPRGELIRVALASFIDGKMAQATILKNMNASLQKSKS